MSRLIDYGIVRYGGGYRHDAAMWSYGPLPPLEEIAATYESLTNLAAARHGAQPEWLCELNDPAQRRAEGKEV